MRFSETFIPTREGPADASPAHLALLTRAGFVRRVGPGLHALLPLGLRTLQNLEARARFAVGRIGGVEVLLPGLPFDGAAFNTTSAARSSAAPSGPFRTAACDGRTEPTLLDARTDAALMALARDDLKSYRDLPQIFFRVVRTFHESASPRGGLLYGHESIAFEAYSLDATEENASQALDRGCAALESVLHAAEMEFVCVAPEGDPSNEDREFHLFTEAGEDRALSCSRCAWTGRGDLAVVPAHAADDEDTTQIPLGKVHTPGRGSVSELARFLGIAPLRVMKTLVYRALEGPLADVPFLCVVRGDDEVNEVLLARAVGAKRVILAGIEQVERVTGAPAGFAGPLGFKGRIFIDRAAASIHNAITGANEADYHFTGVQYARDFRAEIVDVRSARAGDPCPACGDGALAERRTVCCGRAGLSRARMSDDGAAEYVAESGERRAIVLGRFSLDLVALLGAVVETHRDEGGIVWPSGIAPFPLELVSIGSEAEVRRSTASLADALEREGLDVLWDDRDESADTKLKDAERIGVPWRLTIEARGLAGGFVELKRRSSREPPERVSLSDAASTVTARVRAASLGR